MIILLIVQALFGLVSPLNKLGLVFCSPAFFVAGKLLCAGLLLLLYHVWRYKKIDSIPRVHWPLYAQVIVIGNFCVHFLKYWGLQYVPVTKMALIFNVSPFFVALFSYIRFNHTLTMTQCFGLIISFIGLIPLLLTSSPQELLLGEWCMLSWPECAIVLATMLYAWSLTTKRILAHENNYCPTQLNAICFLGGGILAGLYVIAHGWAQIPALSAVPTSMFYIILTTCISKVICSSLYVYLMKFYTPTFLAFMDYWYVIFVAFWSWLLWSEQPTVYFWLSACIIFCGQYLFYREELIKSR